MTAPPAQVTAVVASEGPRALVRPALSDAEALQVLDRVYHGAAEAFQGAVLSREDCVAFSKRPEGASEATYGEMPPESVVRMFRALGARPGDRYWDLGAGTGKTVMLAWLLGLRAAGVELSGARWRSSCRALSTLRRDRGWGSGYRLLQDSNLQLIRANMFDVDFSDADIVLADSLMYSADTMQNITAHARSLRKGARIVTKQRVEDPGFRALPSLRLHESWRADGDAAEWLVYERLDGPQDGARPRDRGQGHVEACS